MKSLLKEFAAYGDTQANLKTSDGSDAGRNDISTKPVDIKFNLMRNAMNSDAGVTGSDVNDYLERAHELNDEVETVGFAIEDANKKGIIKVYVNAQQAGEFEEEMSKLLGLDDDVEAAINELAQKFDIVDIVWPEAPLDGSDNVDSVNDPDADLTIDSEPDAFSLEDPAPVDDAEADPDAESEPEDLGNTLPADDDDGRPASSDDEGTEEKPKKKSLMKDVAGDVDHENKKTSEADTEKGEGEDDIGDESAADDETPPEEDADTDASAEEPAADEEPVSDEEELEPVLNDDGSQKLDKDGNPVMRKKKKEKKEDEVTEEGLRDDVLAHVNRMADLGHKGKFYIEQLVNGAYGGPRKRILSREGKVFYFTNREQALAEADRLTKFKNRAGATASYKFAVRVVESSSTQGESDMIGAKFLERVINEAKPADTDGVNDGMSIPLDSQQRLLVNRMKRPIEKQLVAMYALAGIWGRLLAAVDGIEDRIRDAGDMLRKNASARKAFQEFYKAFATAKGYGPKAMSEELEEALLESKLKRGSALQKKFETILVKLGLPADLVATDGPGAVGPALFKGTKIIDADGNLQSLMTKLAIRLGISGADVNAPLDEPITEAEMHDEFSQLVLTLCAALGIPAKNLDYQRSTLVTSLRNRKATLSNRGMLQQRMEGLLELIKRGSKQQAEPETQGKQPQGTKGTAQQQAQANESIGFFQARNMLKEALLTEGFDELSALTKGDFQTMNIDEPNAGPAMMAPYEGSGQHEETILVVGVDPEADNPSKNLAVSIDGPWDGTIPRKYFTNDKAGYKAALEYANMLRTCNLKSGGRPKGWRNGPVAGHTADKPGMTRIEGEDE